MEDTNLKNILVLKNVESNLIEEAIIILKDNKKTTKSNELVIEEAQMIIEEYSKLNEVKNMRKKEASRANKIGMYIVVLAIFLTQTIFFLLK